MCTYEAILEGKEERENQRLWTNEKERQRERAARIQIYSVPIKRASVSKSMLCSHGRTLPTHRGALVVVAFACSARLSVCLSSRSDSSIETCKFEETRMPITYNVADTFYGFLRSSTRLSFASFCSLLLFLSIPFCRTFFLVISLQLFPFFSYRCYARNSTKEVREFQIHRECPLRQATSSHPSRTTKTFLHFQVVGMPRNAPLAAGDFSIITFLLITIFSALPRAFIIISRNLVLV